MTNTDITIQVNNISKTFRIAQERNSQLKHYFLNPFHKAKYENFEALKDINFEIKKGEFLGIVGRNGSGKSTLLKILASIYQPNTGEVTINGKMTPFLELGVGFNPELSARENIFLNGTILGMSRKYLEKKFDEIIGFAEIERFVDVPVKNFSSGMQVRLAFSIAIQSDADIYLVDEVLAVGDANFQEKCFDVFRKFKKDGKTVVFVSHGMDSIEKFCDRVIWIDRGVVKIDNGTEEVVSQYTNQGNNVVTTIKQSVRNFRFIKEISTLNSKKHVKSVFRSNEDLLFKITLKAKKKEEGLYVGLAIFDKETNAWICGNNSFLDDFTPRIKEGDNLIELKFSKNLFNSGTYYYKVSVFRGDPKNNMIYEVYNSLDFSKIFKILPSKNKNGLLQLPHTWKMKA